MHRQEFLDKRNLKKLEKQLNGRELLLEHTYFAAVDAVSPGRNQASEVLQLQTAHFAISGLRFDRLSKNLQKSGGGLHVFAKCRTTVGQTGFGRNRGFLITATNGKTTIKINAGMGSSFNRDSESKAIRDALRYQIGESKLDSVDVYDVEYWGRMAEENLFEQYFEANGWKLTEVFEYNLKFYLSLESARISKNKIELPYCRVGTYNSLPQLLTIKHRKSSDPWTDTRPEMHRTVSLADLGVEEAGYYNHSDRMRISASQVNAVKAFKRKIQALTSEKTKIAA